MNKDLTVGKPETVLRRFCLPMFASIIFQQLYNIADSLVAGKFIGENALAAVGNGYEITLLFIAFAFGCNIGCSVIVSQFFGAKKLGRVKTAVYTTLISSSVLCFLLMIAGWFFCTDLLHLINTPKNLIADSKLYLNIYILGLPFVFLYNVSTGIFSALGDSKTPFWFLAFSSTANILVDILFVTVFNMGVSGVAWATFLCQGVSCILAVLFVIIRLSKIETEEKSELFSWEILKKVASIAIPSIVQQSFISVGNIFIQGVINAFGAAVMAGYSAAVKLNNLAVTSYSTIGSGVSNFSAQNLGAGKPERVKKGFRSGIKMIWIITVPIVLIYFIFGKYILYLFMDNMSGKAMQTGIQFLRIISPFYFTVAAKLVADGVLRGAGIMKQFMTTTFTDLILRVILAVILSKFLGPVGIWLSWPIGWAISMMISLMFYRKGDWAKQ